MTHGYTVLFDKAVFDDLKIIPADVREKIMSTIKYKLGNNPIMYGENLRKTLKGYWKLKYSGYRAVYSIKGRFVYIHGVHHR